MDVAQDPPPIIHHQPCGSRLWRLFFDADGSQLAYSTLEWGAVNPFPGTGKFYVYDVEKDETVQTLEKGGLVDTISPDWTMVHADGAVLWGDEPLGWPDSFVASLQTKEEVSTLTRFREVAFSLDPRIAAVLGGDLEATTAVRNVETGDNIVTFTVEGAQSTRDLFLRPDGTLMVLRWWNDSGQYLTVWGIPLKGLRCDSGRSGGYAPCCNRRGRRRHRGHTPTDSLRLHPLPNPNRWRC